MKLDHMQLKDFPERREQYLDSELSKEWEKSLLPNLKNVVAAKNYFYEMMQKAAGMGVTEKDTPFGYGDINTGYIYVLDDCIAFVEKKREKNESIQNHGQKRRLNDTLNDLVYHKMTGRYAYESSLHSAQFLVKSFFDPKLNDAVKKAKNKGAYFLNRDTLEQAYRICYYAMRYLEGYAEDPHLSLTTTKALYEVLKKPVPEDLLNPIMLEE